MSQTDPGSRSTPPGPDQGGESSSASGARVVPVDRGIEERAAARLVEAAAPGDPDAGRRFLASARAGGVDISRFFASIDAGGTVGEAALFVPGSGRTATVFTSSPLTEPAEAALAATIEHGCAALAKEDEGVLAQTLLLPRELAPRRAFDRAKFRHIADLSYLRRPRPGAGEFRPPERWPEGVRVRTVDRVLEAEGPGATDDLLVRALGRSYVQTLDCPDLCAIRDPRDVLDSHRGASAVTAGAHADHRGLDWSPELWWLIESPQGPAGAMLFSVSDEQRSAELVYVGIAPELRGRGMGRSLMQLGLSCIAERCGGSITTVTCAVDAQNTPAQRLYARLGFKSFSRRTALVRLAGNERWMAAENRLADAG